MATFKTKIFLFLFVILAFLAPFAAVIAVEKSKRAEKLIKKQEEMAVAKKEIEQARYQYYLDINDQKNNLKQSMGESKAQYEQLLKDQPALIKEKQTTMTQTVIEPVATKKLVEQKVVSSPTSSSKPKSSTTTKTS